MSEVRGLNSPLFTPPPALRNRVTPHSALILLLWWLLGTSFGFDSVVFPLVRDRMAALLALAILAALGGVRLARRWFGADRVDAFTARL